jgi:hypothetical protein
MCFPPSSESRLSPLPLSPQFRLQRIQRLTYDRISLLQDDEDEDEEEVAPRTKKRKVAAAPDPDYDEGKTKSSYVTSESECSVTLRMAKQHRKS